MITKRYIQIAGGEPVQSGTKITDGYKNGTLLFQPIKAGIIINPDGSGKELFHDSGHWYIHWDDGDETLVVEPEVLYKI